MVGSTEQNNNFAETGAISNSYTLNCEQPTMEMESRNNIFLKIYHIYRKYVQMKFLYI